MTSFDDDEPLHGKDFLLRILREFTSLTGMDTALDLPQMYTKPPGADILKALDLLEIKPRSFDTNVHDAQKSRALQSPEISRYLTSIVSNALSWLDSDEEREAIWDTAAARLSERSGRAGREYRGFGNF